jgi:hypothetical protein
MYKEASCLNKSFNDISCVLVNVVVIVLFFSSTHLNHIHSAHILCFNFSRSLLQTRNFGWIHAQQGGNNYLMLLQKAPIDPFTRERSKPSASQGVPLGGMGYVQ